MRDASELAVEGVFRMGGGDGVVGRTRLFFLDWTLVAMGQVSTGRQG